MVWPSRASPKIGGVGKEAVEYAANAQGWSPKAEAIARVKAVAALPYGANPGPTLDAPSPPAVCLGGCTMQGVCFDGKCFCDPGWEGADCSREKKCLPGCEEHGVCAHGLCGGVEAGSLPARLRAPALLQ